MGLGVSCLTNPHNPARFCCRDNRGARGEPSDATQGKFQLLPPATHTTPFPSEKSILGVIYRVLLWADMNAATPLGARGRSVISLATAVERQLRDRAKRAAAGRVGQYAPRPSARDNPPYAAAPSFGKTDWTVGGHAVWNWLQCWTMYVDFPYNMTDPHFRDPGKTGAGSTWSEQPAKGSCREDGTVRTAGNGTRTHMNDWKNVVR